TALASAPRTGPAPNVVKADNVSTLAQSNANSGNWLQNLLKQIAQMLQNFVQDLQKMMQQFFSNLPAFLVAYGPLLFIIGYQVVTNLLGWPTWAAILSAPFVLPLVIAIGVSFLLTTPEVAPIVAGVVPAPVLVSQSPSKLPVAALAPTLAGSAAAPASTPTSAGAPAAPAPAPAAATFGYAVAYAADPETGFGPTFTGRGGVKAPAATIPAAAAAVPG